MQEEGTHLVNKAHFMLFLYSLCAIPCMCSVYSYEYKLYIYGNYFTANILLHVVL